MIDSTPARPQTGGFRAPNDHLRGPTAPRRADRVAHVVELGEVALDLRGPGDLLASVARATTSPGP